MLCNDLFVFKLQHNSVDDTVSSISKHSQHSDAFQGLLTNNMQCFSCQIIIKTHQKSCEILMLFDWFNRKS